LVEYLKDVEAVIVDQAGQVSISSGLRNRVRFPTESVQEGQAERAK